MIKLINWCLCIVVAVLASCDFGNTQSSYKRAIEMVEIPKDFISHFPDEIGTDTFRISNNLIPFDDGRVIGEIVYVYLTYKETNLDSLFNNIKSRALGKTVYSDSCNIIPYKFQNRFYRNFKGQMWRYESWKKDLKDCNTLHLPIPNFIGIDDHYHVGDNGISDSFEIYVLESEKGKVYEEKYYGEQLIMPEGLERGHSKGVAIDRKTHEVIYWFVLW